MGPTELMVCTCPDGLRKGSRQHSQESCSPQGDGKASGLSLALISASQLGNLYRDGGRLGALGENRQAHRMLAALVEALQSQGKSMLPVITGQ